MPITPNDRVLYAVKEMSELLHTNTAYVYSLIKAGLLSVMKLGTYKIRKGTLDQFRSDCESKDLTNPNNICMINNSDVEP